ncbi:hypothetical protein NDA17_003087 [Ustilago hordei]|nr:hypothetical protein NDA17_003087 [Ustilago hordei]
MLAARRSFVKIWLSNAAVAFEEKKIDFRTRSAHLEGFFRLPYYDDLTRELILNVSLLPNAFVHDVLDTSQDPAVVRPSLSLLQGHITVHNSFFATSAEPIHSNEDKAEEDPEPKLPARYVRDQKSQSEQDTWDEAQVRIHGALVISGCLSAASLDPNVID